MEHFPLSYLLQLLSSFFSLQFSYLQNIFSIMHSLQLTRLVNPQPKVMATILMYLESYFFLYMSMFVMFINPFVQLFICF